MSVNNVLNRKMFNTTSTNNNVSARGTGITSGFVDNFQDKLAQVQSANLFPQQPKPRFLDIYGPSLQTFFGALASGRSDAPGKVGRATDILGQALQASAPAMAQAGALRRQLESVDPSAKERELAFRLAMEKDDPRFIYKVVGDRLFKIDTKGELPPEEAVSAVQTQDTELKANPETVFGIFGDSETPTSGVMYRYGDRVEYISGGNTFTKEQFKPQDKPKTGYVEREVPLDNGMIQKEVSMDDGQTFTKIGNPYPRFKPDTPDTELKSVENVFGTVGDNTTPQLVQMFRYGDRVEYKANGQTYSQEEFSVKPKDKDAPTPIFQSKNIGDGMIQDVVSLDNGVTFNNFGEAYPRFQQEESDYKYSNTQSTIINKDGRKVKQTYAIYNKEGVTEPKKFLMFEEDVTETAESIRKSGNLRISEGPNTGKVFGYIEKKDGSIQVHDPMNPLANDTGLVDVKEYGGKFEFFTQSVVGDKESIFGEKNLEDLANEAAGVTLELASGANLINQAIALGGNLDTFNRAILDKGGKFLAQIPIIGEAARDELFNALDANPEDLQQFITSARIFVAQQIATITGEDSARVSEPERFLANQALALLDTMTDSRSAISAIQTSIMATYVGQHRNFMVLGGKNAPPLVAGDGRRGFNEENALFHANFLKNNFGLDNKQIAQTLETMKLMENIGLSQLTQITEDQQSSIINNKDRHNNTLQALIAGTQ
jgi:hypothetical protein